MPRLPSAADLGERPIPSVVRAPSAPSLEASGEGIAHAGRRLAGLGEEILRTQAIEEERADTLRAEDAQNELTLRAIELADGRGGFRSRKGAAAINEPLVPDFYGKFEQAKREIASTLGNDRQRAKFEGRAGVLGIQFKRDLFRHVAQEGEVYGAQVYKNTLETELQHAARHWSDPDSLAASAQRLANAVGERADAQSWDQDTLTLERGQTLSALHSVVVTAALDSDNYAYAKDYFDKASPELEATARHRLSSALNSKRKELEAEARQEQALRRLELQTVVGDVTAAYLTVGRYDGPIPTRQDFTDAYGDSGAERYQSFQRVLEVGSDIAEAALASPAEQNELLAKHKPDPAAGFKEGQGRYELLAGAISKLNRAREDDPGRYLVQHMPSIGDTYRALLETPPEGQTALAEEYVRQVQAAATDLGIQSPKVLPDAFAAGIVSQFYSQKEGGEPAALAIIAERERWGAEWPAVWAQLSKDLPGAAYVIGAGMSPEAGRRLAEVSAVKPEELRASLPPRVRPADVQTSVRKELDDAILSFAGQPGAERLAANLLDSAERLTTRYIASGKDTSDAAEQAAREVFNDRYGFISVGDSTIRVPRPYDAGDVKSALRVVAKELGGIPRIDEAAWSTLPNDAGVVLTWMGGAVERPDGSVVAYSWDDLLNRAATLEFRPAAGLPTVEQEARRLR